jgi:predicted nucleotidyltransferase
MQNRLPLPATTLAAFCVRHKIRSLSLFGSTLKGTSTNESDIDLLVEFEPHCTPGLLGIAGMESQLSELLGGRPVDLRTAQDLSHYFRNEVIQSAELQYASH